MPNDFKVIWLSNLLITKCMMNVILPTCLAHYKTLGRMCSLRLKKKDSLVITERIEQKTSVCHVIII